MPKGYLTSHTSVPFMNYHFVWCPKYRRKVLVDDVKARLDVLIRQKCSQLGCEVLTLAIMDDHVHLFVRATPLISPNPLIGQVNGHTARMLRQEFPKLKSRLPTLWTRSYFVSTHGHISDDMTQQYIDEQKGM
jgi:putative transposase